MDEPNIIPAADPAVVLEFLTQTGPFKDLELSVLKEISGKFTQDFYPRGTIILEQNVSEVTHFRLVTRGGVKVHHIEPDGSVRLVDYVGERVISEHWASSNNPRPIIRLKQKRTPSAIYWKGKHFSGWYTAIRLLHNIFWIGFPPTWLERCMRRFETRRKLSQIGGDCTCSLPELKMQSEGRLKR